MTWTPREEGSFGEMFGCHSRHLLFVFLYCFPLLDNRTFTSLGKLNPSTLHDLNGVANSRSLPFQLWLYWLIRAPHLPGQDNELRHGYLIQIQQREFSGIHLRKDTEKGECFSSFISWIMSHGNTSLAQTPLCSVVWEKPVNRRGNEATSQGEPELKGSMVMGRRI